MKKSIIALLLCMSLALPLAACKGGETSTDSTETDIAATDTATGTESGETADGETEEAAETEEADPFIYAFEYDLTKYVKLCDYKNLEYTAEDTAVTEEELQSYIDYILDSSTDYEHITDRAAADGDTVVIDYAGTIDGEAFSGGSAEGYELKLGSHTFIDGFEDGLIGVTPGETVTLDLAFPDDYYNKDYAGKKVQFETTLEYIEGDEVVPELTDDFAKGLGIDGVETARQLRDYLRDNIAQDKEASAAYSIQSQLLDQVVEKSEILSYPPEMLQVYVDSVKESVQEEIDYLNESQAAAEETGETAETADATEATEKETEPQDPESYFQENYGESIEDYCKESVGEMMIICAVAQQEGIEITEETFDQDLAAYAEENNLGEVELLKSQYRENYLKLSMIYDRVLKKLQEYSKAVEASAD